MRLNAPRKGVWIFSCLLVCVSLVSHIIYVPGLTPYTAFWVMAAAWLMLALSTYFKNL